MIDYVNEALFKQNSIHKDWSIVGENINLTNDDLYTESIKITESLCSEDNLVFGSCEASKIEFITSDLIASFQDKTITVSVCLNHDFEHPFTLGTYIVTEVEATAEKSRRKITAYDKLYTVHETNVASWYNSLTFPLTLSNFRKSFLDYLGISYANTNLVNDNMTVERTIDAEVISGTDILRAICEINGVFGHIGRDGVFRFISLKNNSVYTVNLSMYRPPFEHAEYTVQGITAVQIRQEEGDIGVIIGSPGNDYIVENNFLVYGKNTTTLSTIAANLLYAISNKTYIPCKVDCIGNPCVEVGDRISIEKSNGVTKTTYVMQRTISGVQALNDIIISEGDKYKKEEVNGVHKDIIQLKGKSNVLERSIEETRSTITDVAEGLQTEIVQTAEGIQVQIEDLQAQIDGETAYYERETGTPTLLNYPYWDFTTAIPCNNTIRLDEIYTDEMAPGGNKFPHFYYSEMDRKNHRSDLCYVDDTNVAYRFVLENGTWYWKEIADSEYTQILSRLSTLEATSEHLQTEYSELSIDLRDNYWTETETSSAIEQKAGEITTSVSQTYQTLTGMSDYYTKSQTNSQITQKANEITQSVSATYQTISGMSNYYDKDDSDSKYQTQSGMSNYYTKSQTNTQITQKSNEILSTVSNNYQTISDMSNYYTKALADGKYQTQSAMSNYYTKTQVYTKAEIQQRESQVKISVKDDIAVDYYNKNQTNNKFQTQEDMEDYYDKTEANEKFYYNSDAELLVGRVEDVEADNVTLHSEVSAKVSETYGNNSSQFSWVLRSTGFVLKNSGTEVFRADKNGINVTGSGSFSGNITARSGYIGNGSNGFTIGNTFIRNGKTSRDETTNNGIYLGTDGIALGKGKFKVTNTGTLTATSATITGSVTATSGAIGGWNIANNDLSCNNVKIQGDGSIVCSVNGAVKWALANNGTLSATNASIQGNVNASTGSIGGWTINSTNLSSNNGRVVIQNDGSLVCTIGGELKWALGGDGNLTAVNANLSGYSKSSEIEATYATITSLNAVDGKFNNLNADNITSGTINAARIAGGSITSGKIAASTITAGNINMTSFSGSDIYAGTLRSTNSVIYFGGNAYTPVEMVIGNYRYRVMANRIY